MQDDRRSEERSLTLTEGNQVVERNYNITNVATLHMQRRKEQKKPILVAKSAGH